MKVLLTMLLTLLLSGCFGPRPADLSRIEEYKLIKLSVEPDTKGCSGELFYRIFVLGNSSLHTPCAKDVGMALSEKEYNYYQITFTTTWLEGGGFKWRPTVNAYGKLFLVPCSKFRDTQRYVVQESSQHSDVLFGLVYSNSAHSTTYQVRDEDLIMPCLKG